MANDGTWVSVKPGLPDAVQTFTDGFDSVADALLAVLNVSLEILEVAKAFAVDVIDPLSALVDEIVSTVDGLLSDLRQVGVYFSGDLYLKPPFRTLRGGYAAYERRMVGLLVDRSDPTRPDFSSNTTVLGVFLYVNAGVSGLDGVVKAVNQVRRFFGLEGVLTPFTKPVGLEVKYGVDEAPAGAYKALEGLLRDGEVPTSAVVTWSMSGTGVAAPPPKGFLVEVSTLKDGLMLGWEAPIPSAEKDENEQETRVSGVFVGPDGTPFRLYGGAEVLDGDLENLWPFGDDGRREDGKVWIYAFKSAADNTPIPLDKLETEDGKHLFQRTFYVDGGGLNAVPGQEFQVALDWSEMPYHADVSMDSNGNVTLTPEDDPARTVYVRVSAVSDAVSEASLFKYRVDPEAPLAAVSTKSSARLETTLDPSDKGPVSDPVLVTFPHETELLKTITAALAVMVLSRSDKQVDANGSIGTVLHARGLEELAGILMPLMFENPSKWFAQRGSDPIQFRRRVLWRCRAVANDLFRQVGSLGEAIEQSIVEQGDPLLSWTWNEARTWASLPGSEGFPNQTILESLESTSFDGLARNLWSCWKEGIEAEWQAVRVKPQDSEDIHPTSGADFPVAFLYFGPDNESIYCRDAFPDEVYQAAAFVLSIASSPMTAMATRGNWKAMRLLPQGLPFLENAMQQVLAWAVALKGASQTSVDALLDYIQFLEARILQIQALIARIDALLNQLTITSFPSMHGLVVTAEGTLGLVSSFLSAENKPSDSTDSYGAGVVMVAGGLPNALADLLKLFFPEDE